MYVLYGLLRSALATVDWIFRWNNLTRCAAHNWQGGRIEGQRTIQREGLNPWTIVNNNNTHLLFYYHQSSWNSARPGGALDKAYDRKMRNIPAWGSVWTAPKGILNFRATSSHLKVLDSANFCYLQSHSQGSIRVLLWRNISVALTVRWLWLVFLFQLAK